jgi:ABC-2 type transport system ATP-binding protein
MSQGVSTSAVAARPIVEVSHLAKTYCRDGWLRQQRVEALRGVSLSVRPGEIFGLIGPNGAGKTTLIKILLGIVRKSAGEAQLLGHAAGHRQSRRRVGYLPEGHRIPHHLTANTALEYYGRLSCLAHRDIRARRPELLKRMGLTKAADRPVKGYSKGMLQRLGLAQALIHDPDVLFLDEPTDGVDPRGRAEIRDLLLELKGQGKSMFINSHQLQELELVCDRVAMLEQGQVRFLGTLAEATKPQDDVSLLLAGEAETIRRSLGGIATVEPRPEGQVQAIVPVKTQADIDRCIDTLRNAGVSIVALSRRRRSLEEAFLSLVPRQEDV